MKVLSDFSIFQKEDEHLISSKDGWRIYSSAKQPGIRAVPLLMQAECCQPLYIEKLFRGKVNQHYKYRQEKAPYLGVEYVREGSLAVRRDNRAYLVESGEIFLILPGKDTEIVSGPEGFCVKDSFAVRGPIISSVLEANGLDTSDCITRFDWRRFLAALERLETLSMKNTVADFMENSLIAFEILAILSYTQQEAEPNFHLLSLVDYMKKHLSLPLHIKTLCVQCGCSENYLLQAFRAAYDKTPHQYLIKLRMEYAANLMLNHPELSIKEIAAMCGYTNSMNFSTAFRLYYQSGPREFRKEHNEGY